MRDGLVICRNSRHDRVHHLIKDSSEVLVANVPSTAVNGCDGMCANQERVRGEGGHTSDDRVIGTDRCRPIFEIHRAVIVPGVVRCDGRP